jgi:hypothetical protein
MLMLQVSVARKTLSTAYTLQLTDKLRYPHKTLKLSFGMIVPQTILILTLEGNYTKI